MKGVTIDPAASLYLLDMDTKLLFGVFKAESPLTENLDPTAFVNWFPPAASMKGSPLPLQLRFQVVIQCNPISLFDPDYVASMYKVHLGGELRWRDAKNLKNLFSMRSGVFPSHHEPLTLPPRGPGGGPPNDRFMASVYRPPFKFVDVVHIGINADHGEVKRK